VPLPLQVEADVSVTPPAGQLCARQTVAAGHLLHAPAPSHLPVVPHVLAAWVAQSLPWAVFTLTFAHVPVVTPVLAARHDLHVVLQTSLQQTPSAHLPLAHSACVVHALPSGRPTHV
jgi:hypothetical protein